MSDESTTPQTALNESLAEGIHSSSEEDLLAVASSPNLTEDLARALLRRGDLSPAVLTALADNHAALKLRSVIVGLVSHPKTPRRISIPLTRHMFTFELMQVALQPATPADLKMKVEDALVNRMSTVSAGEKITVAKRGSTRIAASLLTDRDPRILEAALNNPYMTEAYVGKALGSPDATALLFDMVWRHAKWSFRTELRLAMLRAGKVPPHIAIEIAKAMPPAQAKNALASSRINAALKARLLEAIGAAAKASQK